MDNYKYVFFPNPLTGLTAWVRVPLSMAQEFDREITPLIAQITESSNNTEVGYLAGEWDMVQPLEGIAPRWDMVKPSLASQEGVEGPEITLSDCHDLVTKSHEAALKFPVMPSIPNNLSDLGIAWGPILAIFGTITGWVTDKGMKSGQHYTEWREFVDQMGCTKGKYCYCCCPPGSSGNCYRIEQMDDGHFEMLPRERIGENPRFDCRQLPDFVFKLIPNCGTKTGVTGTGVTTYKDPGGPPDGAGEFWAKNGLWIFGGLLGLILFMTVVKKK